MLTSRRDCRKPRYRHGYGRGASVRLAPGNVEHSTPNIEPPTSIDRATGAHWMFDVGRSMFDVGCWMLDVYRSRLIGRITPTIVCTLSPTFSAANVGHGAGESLNYPAWAAPTCSNAANADIASPWPGARRADRIWPCKPFTVLIAGNCTMP
jgi:hypothetical protein